jgi:hypothetical protein
VNVGQRCRADQSCNTTKMWFGQRRARRTSKHDPFYRCAGDVAVTLLCDCPYCREEAYAVWALVYARAPRTCENWMDDVDEREDDDVVDEGARSQLSSRGDAI